MHNLQRRTKQQNAKWQNSRANLPSLIDLIQFVRNFIVLAHKISNTAHSVSSTIRSYRPSTLYFHVFCRFFAREDDHIAVLRKTVFRAAIQTSQHSALEVFCEMRNQTANPQHLNNEKYALNFPKKLHTAVNYFLRQIHAYIEMNKCKIYTRF